jgi:hypothetical protein
LEKGTTKKYLPDVIPAKAGIHLDLDFDFDVCPEQPGQSQNGSQRSLG